MWESDCRRVLGDASKRGQALGSAVESAGRSHFAPFCSDTQCGYAVRCVVGGGVNRFSKPVPMSTSATVVALVRGLVELQLADDEALACESPESRSRRRKRAVTESNRGCPQRLGLKGPLAGSVSAAIQPKGLRIMSMHHCPGFTAYKRQPLHRISVRMPATSVPRLHAPNFFLAFVSCK